MMLAIPVLLFPVLASNKRLIGSWRLLLRFYFPIVLLAAIFMELSTVSFVDQFDSRPNILFVEYLDHPGEVFATLWAAYKLPISIAMLLLVAIGFSVTRTFTAVTADIRPTGFIAVAVLTPFLLLGVLGVLRRLFCRACDLTNLEIVQVDLG